jgi:F-type H+-transporting ATPase subunit epsilon
VDIKILTPESVIFEGKVSSVLLPGKNGDFHIMKDHIATVASLSGGKIRLYTDQINEDFAKNFTKENERENVFSFAVNSGVVEFSNNNGVILAE